MFSSVIKVSLNQLLFSMANLCLTSIPSELEQIKSWGKPVIAVCRSGARSGQAAQFLSNNGIDTINGGPWQNLVPHV